MLRSVVLAALLGASSVLATKCSLENKCPEDSPCCSQYGECGVGAFCLGGCDPRMSFSLEACVPAPVCQDKKYKLNSIASVADINDYLGDPSKADWVAQGEPVAYGGNVLLTMPKGSVGTVMASTTYMWYGNVKARMKTSRGRGVVTAFILLSDVKDEIDYEFVGVDLKTAQTNFYFQGIPNYSNSGNITLSDTYNNFHDYEINWTPDKIEWLIDGQVGRTVNRKDTWNPKTNQWEYPQTPARVQLSIWPGGLATNAKGTIDWAGGEIDWNSDDIKKNKYYFTTFSDVSVECYNAKKGPGSNSGKSYTYSSIRGTNDTVIDGDKRTILASLEGSGIDMDAGKQAEEETATDSAAPPKKTQAQVPGGSNGASGQDHSGDKGSNKPGSGNGGSGSGGSGGSGGGSGSGCDVSSFNQDCKSKADGGSGDKNNGSRASASALAIIVAVSALFWL